MNVIRLFFTIFSLITVLKLNAQTDSTLAYQKRSDVIQDERINLLIAKRVAINEKREGRFSGYRVQIHFGPDREKAKEAKAKFVLKYTDKAAYDTYDQPNFKIRVGNFRTRLEAHAFMKELQVEFPGAFIVQCDIEPEK